MTTTIYFGMTTEDTIISQSSYDKPQCTDDKLNTIPVYSTNTTKTEQTIDKIIKSNAISQNFNDLWDPLKLLRGPPLWNH